MANFIICVILVLICIFAVKSFCKTLRQGCCGGGGDAVEKLEPADRDISHYPYAYRIRIEGMTCGNCAARIANAFNGQEGYLAEVNLKKKSALVRTKEEADPAELRVVVSRAGYTVAGIEAVEG